MTHHLKTTTHYFQAIWEGRKRFETRLNDRGFQADDFVILHEIKNGYKTGRQIKATITYVLTTYQKEGYVTFGLQDTINRNSTGPDFKTIETQQLISLSAEIQAIEDLEHLLYQARDHIKNTTGNDQLVSALENYIHKLDNNTYNEKTTSNSN